jgi:hypothetical protein
MRTLVAALLVGALILIGFRLVAAESPQQYYGDHAGNIRGYVLDVTGRPHDWAVVYAKNSQHEYQAFSGYDGAYLLRVPVGVYNVTVNAPVFTDSATKLTANGSTANVTENGTVRIDFHLQESPIPEFPPSIIPIAIALAFATTLILRRIRKLQSHD